MKEDKRLDFVIKRYRHSKRVLLRVYGDGSVVVSANPRVSKKFINEFVERNISWVNKQLEIVENRKKTPLGVCGRDDYLEKREEARTFVHSRLEHFNVFYNFKYNRISIRNQKTCWGSCSGKSNLNFNYKIALLPPHLADYIIVHELCHLDQMNHSLKFWRLVAQTIPEYKKLRGELRKISLGIL